MVAQKKLGILFLVSVILAFFAGLYASRVVPAFSPNKPQDVFDYLTEALKEYYYYDIDQEQEHLAFIASIEATINTYAKLANDPYTRLIKVPLQNDTSEENFRGFGMYITFEESNVRVIQTIRDTPAYMRLFPNDLIIGLMIDQDPVYFEGLSTSQVETYLSATHSCLKTLIVKDPDGIINPVELNCDIISTPSIYGVNLGLDDIAYIKLDAFSEETASLFSDILNTYQQGVLQASNSPKTLIIDLRDNPGGSVVALHNGGSNLMPGILQQLIARQGEQTKLFSLIDKNGHEISYHATSFQSKSYDIKLLVNENSASAAEVMAAVMQSYAGYQVYGAPTFGKNVYQNQIEILRAHGYIYYLNYTEGKWYYDGNKQVGEHPIPVIPIENKGIKAIEMPVYGGTLVKDTYSPYLSNYQHFLNYFFEYEGAELLRTDGYFDQKTEDAILTFNTLHDRPNITVLDRQTSILIYQIYEEHYHDLTKDFKLQQLIQIINEGA